MSAFEWNLKIGWQSSGSMMGMEMTNTLIDIEHNVLGTKEKFGTVAYGPFVGWYRGGAWRTHLTYLFQSLMKSANTNTVYYGYGIKWGNSFRLAHPLRFFVDLTYSKYEEKRNAGETEPTPFTGDSQIKVTQLVLGVNFLLW